MIEKKTPKRVPEEVFAISEVLSQKKAPNRNTFFLPNNKAHVDGKSALLHIGCSVFDCSELLNITYRKLKCSSKDCHKLKWADEFDWNKKGFEGPFPLLWGKRDSFCKQCRSKERQLRYKKKKKQNKRRLELNGRLSFSSLGQPNAEAVLKVISQLICTEIPNVTFSKEP